MRVTGTCHIHDEERFRDRRASYSFSTSKLKKAKKRNKQQIKPTNEVTNKPEAAKTDKQVKNRGEYRSCGICNV